MNHRLSSGQRGLFIALVAWSLGWKAMSLWHAARDGSRPWYSALFLINSAGILDALYIFRFSSWGRERRGHDEISPGYVQSTHTQET